MAGRTDEYEATEPVTDPVPALPTNENPMVELPLVSVTGDDRFAGRVTPMALAALCQPPLEDFTKVLSTVCQFPIESW